MAKPALDTWLRDQAFLPAVLRDFHKQKTLFKRIGQAIEKRRNSLEATSVDHELPTWLVGHIYVIDYFLWFMAKHGYTLQKTHARYEFYDRVEKAAREKKKILKKLSKPQYSDPRYFGHKRIPKRKPPYKMRYCDECAIRH